jgi:uncharacterized protein
LNRRYLASCILIALTWAPLSSQNVQVNRQNKTIAISADSSVSIEPDIAVLHFGYHNYGKTKDSVYVESLRTAEHILKGLFDSGVMKGQIDGNTISIQLIEPADEWTAEEKKERKYKAQQSWRVRIPVKDAELILNSAIRNGANDVESPTWEFSKPSELQAKAGAAALSKAKTIATEMAAGLGNKLGELVYASNKAPAQLDMLDYYWLRGTTLNTQTSQVSRAAGPLEPTLKLYPQKVQQDATVYAVFSIE